MLQDEPYLIQTEGGNKPEAEYDGFCNNLAKYIADYLKTDCNEFFMGLFWNILFKYLVINLLFKDKKN